jgi:thioredoxin reductase
MENVVIVGTGCAGLTAAIYATRGGLKTQVYAGMQHGGQLTTTSQMVYARLAMELMEKRTHEDGEEMERDATELERDAVALERSATRGIA